MFLSISTVAAANLNRVRRGSTAYWPLGRSCAPSLDPPVDGFYSVRGNRDARRVRCFDNDSQSASLDRNYTGLHGGRKGDRIASVALAIGLTRSKVIDRNWIVVSYGCSCFCWLCHISFSFFFTSILTALPWAENSSRIGALACRDLRAECRSTCLCPRISSGIAMPGGGRPALRRPGRHPQALGDRRAPEPAPPACEPKLDLSFSSGST